MSINPDPGNNANFWDASQGLTSWPVRAAVGSPYWTTPVGEFENSASPYGTFDQGRNVQEWNETAFGSSNRGTRGGELDGTSGGLLVGNSGNTSPLNERAHWGFRVASLAVPEPASIVLLIAGGLCLLAYAWRRRTLLHLPLGVVAMFRRCAVVLSVFCLVFSNAQLMSAAPSYRVIDLGAIPGGGYSEARAINEKGQIVGFAITANGNNHAFLYDGSIMIDLGTLTGDKTSYAYDVNDGSKVVGTSFAATGTYRGFLYNGSAMIDLGSLGGGTSDANGVNNLGQIVGSADYRERARRMLSSKAVRQCPTWAASPVPHTAWQPVFNDNGQIVGTSGVMFRYLHAFSYSGSTMTDLGTLPGGKFCAATDISSNGLIAGYSDTAGGAKHAFVYNGSTMTDLGTLNGGDSSPWGINSSGQVVGWSSGGERPFLYDGSTMLDLNSLLDSSSTGWTIQRASDINDKGQIAANAVIGAGVLHAVLLTPVPEPSTLVLLAGGTIGLLGYAWRRRRSRRAVACLAAIVVVLSGVGSASAVVMYNVTDLGTLGGDHAYAEGIDSSGRVVGSAYFSGSSTEFVGRNGVGWHVDVRFLRHGRANE